MGCRSVTATSLNDADLGGFIPSDGPVGVAGLGITGRAVARVLLDAGFSVVAWDSRSRDGSFTASIQSLIDRGLEVFTADAPAQEFEKTFSRRQPQCVVASPGWHPDSLLFLSARQHQVPIWSEAELAWKMRRNDDPQWIVLTGTNGKTTTVTMLEHIFAAANVPARAVGNIGEPLIEAALDSALDFVLVELSSFQLHFTHSIQPVASALLNIAPDHLDWHGTFDAYVADKGKIYQGTQKACLYNAGDEVTRELLEQADVASGCVAVGVTLSAPQLGTLGVVENHLYDRGFFLHRRSQALELGSVADISSQPAPHLVMNALFAAGLSLGAGISAEDLAVGLRSYRDSPSHDADRGEVVKVENRITFINNSKATNPHAAHAALSGFPAKSTVWILGGDSKGLELETLVTENLTRLKGVVLLGADRSALRSVFARHAPSLPLIEVDASQTEGVNVKSRETRDEAVERRIMERAVAGAEGLAAPGDYIVLAPACASIDQFSSFQARGAAFRKAVTREQV